MTIDERMDKIEAALGKQDALVIELRDAVTVAASLEARHGRMMKDHAEWLVSQDERIATLDAKRREDNKVLDERISKLVSTMGAFISEGKK